MSQTASDSAAASHRLSVGLSSAVSVGVWSAAVTAIGYIPHPPNIEGVTITVALAGAILGWRSGSLVGIIGMGLYSLFNPWGPPSPLLLIAQMIAMAGVATFAGVAYRFWYKPRWMFRMLWGGIGLVCAIWYDALTTATMPLLAGMEGISLVTLLSQQIIFTAVKAAWNAAIFAVAFLPIASRLKKVYDNSLLNRERMKHAAR